jgi:NTP pyrophosphatase (non-canonical NTP hydrolase)
MTLNEYQDRAMSTCMDTCDNYEYMMDNLTAEVGEFAGKVAKMKRKKEIFFTQEGDFYFTSALSAKEVEARMEELKKEAGDILWQTAGLCFVMGWRLEDVGQGNLEKLASRKARGVIEGEGDNR